MNKWFLILAGAFILIIVSPLLAQSELTDNFNRGNSLYADGDYKGAINAYEKAATSGFESPELYFNLGNAYFRDGQLGKCLVNYLRARRLDPRDDDIQTNMEFARQFTVDKLEISEETILLDYVNRFFNSFKLSEIAWLSVILYLILVAIIIIGFLYHWLSIPRPLLVIVIILFVISAAFTGVKYDRDIITRTGVVTAASTEVKNGPGEDFKDQFTAHAGLVFNIEREDSGWYLVKFENRVKGWLPQGVVSEI